MDDEIACHEFNFALSSLCTIGPDIRQRLEASRSEVREQRLRAIDCEILLSQKNAELKVVEKKRVHYKRQTKKLMKRLEDEKVVALEATDLIVEASVEKLKAEHDLEVNDLKAALQSNNDVNRVLEDRLRVLTSQNETLRSDRSWLVTMGLKHVISKLHQSHEYSDPQAQVRLLNYQVGCHDGLVVGFNLGRFKHPLSSSSYHNPGVAETLEKTLDDLDNIQYPYLDQLASTDGLPLQEFQKVDPAPAPVSEDQT